MRFKAEIVLFMLAIVLYLASVYCYFYEARQEGWLPYINYPYKEYTIPLVVIASVFVIIAAILYSKRR